MDRQRKPKITPVSRALKLLRVYNEMSISETAKKIGVSVGWLSEIEREVKKPTLELINIYASKFNVTTGQIFSFSDALGNKKLTTVSKLKIFIEVFSEE